MGCLALSRMYRGEHHPTDVLGSVIFAALWLTATTLLIKPNAAQRKAAPQAARVSYRTLTGRVVSLLPARAGAGK